jgi:hypothetical protein
LNERAQGVLGIASDPEERANLLSAMLDALDDLTVVDNELPSLLGSFALTCCAAVALA